MIPVLVLGKEINTELELNKSPCYDIGNLSFWIVPQRETNSVPFFIAALTQYHSLFIFTIQFAELSVQSSSNFVEQLCTLLVFYACVKSCSAFAGAFVRG